MGGLHGLPEDSYQGNNMIIHPRVAKRIRRALFSADGVPRIRTSRQSFGEVKRAAQRVTPVPKRRKFRLAPLPESAPKPRKGFR